MKIKRCGNCGSKSTKAVESTGPFVWKDFPSVFINKGIKIQTCLECKEELLPLDLAPKLDKLIESSIASDIPVFIHVILKREGVMQKTLCERLGVTPEYLSEIKSGRKLPSFQTYNFLKILALSPKAYNFSDPHKRIKTG